MALGFEWKSAAPSRLNSWHPQLAWLLLASLPLPAIDSGELGKQLYTFLHSLHYINLDVPGLGATCKNESTKGKTLSGFKSCRIWQGIPTVQEFVILSTFVVKSLKQMSWNMLKFITHIIKLLAKHTRQHMAFWQWRLLRNWTWDPKDEPSEPWPSRRFPEESRTCGKSVVAPRMNARNIYEKRCLRVHLSDDIFENNFRFELYRCASMIFYKFP